MSENVTIDKNKESEDPKNKPEATVITEKQVKAKAAKTSPKKSTRKADSPRATEPGKRTHVLKTGVEIRPFGEQTILNPEDITDEIATWLLETGRNDKSDFTKLPEGYKK